MTDQFVELTESDLMDVDGGFLLSLISGVVGGAVFGVLNLISSALTQGVAWQVGTMGVAFTPGSIGQNQSILDTLF